MTGRLSSGRMDGLVQAATAVACQSQGTRDEAPFNLPLHTNTSPTPHHIAMVSAALTIDLFYPWC